MKVILVMQMMLMEIEYVIILEHSRLIVVMNGMFPHMVT